MRQPNSRFATILLTACVWPASAQTRQLHGNVPAAVAHLQPLRRITVESFPETI